MMDWRYIVVGAGFAGCVIAERIASQLNEKVLVIEKKKHIGGHCYDFIDENGFIIHKYGPHLFHTDSKVVWDYLSMFTDWHFYQHRVLAFVDGNLIVLPINLNSIYQMFPNSFAKKVEKKLLYFYQFNERVPILELLKNEDKEIKLFAQYVYSKIFQNYTAKQWNVDPKLLDPSVTARVPVIISKDNRYFQDNFQAVPKSGYTKIFNNILNHDNIKLLLGVNFKDIGSIKNNKIKINGNYFEGTLIYTGCIDELLDFCFGRLPYRSLKFEFETIHKEFYQSVATVNYPNSYEFTRITEYKHIHPLETDKTKIVYEYPETFQIDRNDPYYPLLTDEGNSIYNKYSIEANKVPNLILLGRLAEYKYYDMDDIILRAIRVFEENIINGQ